MQSKTMELEGIWDIISQWVSSNGDRFLAIGVSPLGAFHAVREGALGGTPCLGRSAMQFLLNIELPGNVFEQSFLTYIYWQFNSLLIEEEIEIWGKYYCTRGPAESLVFSSTLEGNWGMYVQYNLTIKMLTLKINQSVILPAKIGLFGNSR